MNKTTIRSQLLAQRKNLTAQQSALLSEKITDHIIGSALYQQAKHVALYWPFNGEADITGLLKVKDKQHYLPSIQGQQMQFQAFSTKIHMKKNRFGISQPTFIDSLQAAELDLCLMPLVGFDMLGNRLGMGGGFYDRYFATNNGTGRHPQLAGVGYQFQQYDQLPVQNWDVRMNYLYTEQGQFKL